MSSQGLRKLLRDFVGEGEGAEKMRISDEKLIRVKKHIIRKLYMKQAFSKGHLLYERLMHGIEKNLAGAVLPALEQLLREEIVVYYGRTKHDDAYQLNIQKLREIREMLEQKS